MPEHGVARVDGVLVSGWHASAVLTLLERHLNAARERGAPIDRRVVELFEALRDYSQGCAAQPAQPRDDDDAAWWPADDEIDTKEAARLMGTSEQNVRKRAGKSLPAVQPDGPGGRWVLSRRDVLARSVSRRKVS